MLLACETPAVDLCQIVGMTVSKQYLPPQQNRLWEEIIWVPYVTTRVFESEGARVSIWVMTEKDLTSHCWFWRWKWAVSQWTQRASRSWKGKAKEEIQKEGSPAKHLILAHREYFQTSDLQNCNKFVSFETTKPFVISYSSDRKLIY